MLECLIIGDSIAVGVGMQRPECKTIATVGITSKNWVAKNLFVEDARTTVISLGTNDSDKTKESLLELRSKISGKVYWILPPRAKQQQRDIVMQIASERGDVAIGTDKLAPDNIHPTVSGYKGLAQGTR